MSTKVVRVQYFSGRAIASARGLALLSIEVVDRQPDLVPEVALVYPWATTTASPRSCPSDMTKAQVRGIIPLTWAFAVRPAECPRRGALCIHPHQLCCGIR